MQSEKTDISRIHLLSARGINVVAVIFFLGVFYPLGVEMGGRLLWVELLAPVVFGFLIFENILRGRPMILQGNSIYYVALLVLILWAMISWARFPIYGSGTTVSSGAEVGIKSYYRIFVGISVFFASLWFTKYYLRGEFHLYLKILLYFSLFIGLVRILSFFMGFDIPFMYGVFRYNVEASTEFGGMTLRLSGLDIAGYCGTFSLLALRQSRQPLKPRWFISLLVVFTVFIFLHAGRTSAICYLLALFYYGVFIEGLDTRKLMAGIAMIVLLVVALQFLPEEVYQGQMGRITAVRGGVQGQYADRRGYVFKSFLEEFYEHPLFGRGIRPVSIERADRNTAWIQQMLSDGGHGSYHSMLGLFGLGGIFFLAIFLFLTLGKTHFILNRPRGPNREVYMFIMLCLVYKLLYFYTSGKGYTDYGLYLVAGMFVALQAKSYGLVKKL